MARRAFARKLLGSVEVDLCFDCRGAPVDVTRDAQCSYCRAPIAILDADAVKRTLEELDAGQVDLSDAVDLLMRRI